MGKANRIRGDLDDVEVLLEIINILKDVSANKFFVFVKQKSEFSKFFEIFLLFFDLLESIDTNSPLVRNTNPGTDIIVVTSEAGFMSQFNSRVCSAVAKEAAKHADPRIVCVGAKGEDKLKQMGLTVDKVYTNVSDERRYEIALGIRDYTVERIMSGAAGKSLCVYTWPKSFNILKPRVIKLLPATELLGGEDADEVSPQERKAIRRNKDVILESHIDAIMKILADIWVAARIFEILTDTKLAEAAAQSQQLEQAVESLSSEKKGMMVSFKKASKDELNKSMREVFSASSVIKRR